MILAGLISRVARLAGESGVAVGGTGPPSDTRESDPFLRHITMTLLVPTVLCILNGVTLTSALLDGRDMNSHYVSSSSLTQHFSGVIMQITLFLSSGFGDWRMHSAL